MPADLRTRTPVLHPLRVQDLSQVTGLLKDLPKDYPRGDVWLKRRLGDVLDGKAQCKVASVGGRLLGTIILTPKTSSMKLSTIMVSEGARGLGIGSQLMDLAIETAALEGFDEIFVTVAEHTFPLLRPLLGSRGFTRLAFERHRYGLNRHELIFARIDK